MGEYLQRLLTRRATLSKLDDLAKRNDSALVIHYSCESFYDRPDGGTPRVTSIAVRNLASGQTESFSIHKVAEIKRVLLEDIVNHYDDLEREMLHEFFAFVDRNRAAAWIHWNMRDINCGFQAIEHRYRVLGRMAPYVPAEERKFDLARAMVALYGRRYTGHPRLENLMKRNKITDQGFLVGADEAAAFESREFVRLHQSTLRKVDILANIFERAHDRTLTTNAPWYEARGLHPAALLELITEHWAWTLVTVVTTAAGLVVLFV